MGDQWSGGRESGWSGEGWVGGWMDVCGVVGAVGKVESNANPIKTWIEFEVLSLVISFSVCPILAGNLNIDVVMSFRKLPKHLNSFQLNLLSLLT